MVSIIEKRSQKVVGETSLHISFPYSQELFNKLCLISGSSYSKATKIFEIPLTYLAQVIDICVLYFDVQLQISEKLAESNQLASNIDLIPMHTSLYKHQEDAVRFGLTNNDWLLLDAPGLGKTLSIISLAHQLKARDNIRHCLVICGLNTLKENWKKEIERHSDSKGKILGQLQRKNGNKYIGSVKDRCNQLKEPIEEFFIITNIETLRDKDIISLLKKDSTGIDMIVFDEIHTTKNPSSIVGKNILQLTKTKYKIGATGTLLLNSPLDAYIPLTWIGVNKATYTNFKNYYCIYKDLRHTQLVGYKNMNYLKDSIDKYGLRRPKEILNLPPKVIINEYVTMDDKQAKFYQELVDGIKGTADKVSLSTLDIRSMITRLRQVTACPAILTSQEINSAKIDRACELAKEIISNGDKVVIFSTYKQTAGLLFNKLKEYNPSLNTGDINDTIIDNNIATFQTDPSNKCFIGTWQKCGTGITLTAANYVIFIDTPWTAGTYEQAQDRCYRIGTNKSVFIYHLITADTIDEKILNILETKAAISDYMIDDKVSNASADILRKLILDL